MPRYVGALDQGTTSTRFMVFDAGGAEVARRQIEHEQILPQPGWVEHDPIEIAARTNEVITGALRVAGLTGADLAAIGVTNQRETTVVWNLTGGTDGGTHVTDVTNASRTLLMDLRNLDWDDELLKLFGVPRRMLPAIRSSSDRTGYGTTRRNGPAGAEVLV